MNSSLLPRVWPFCPHLESDRYQPKISRDLISRERELHIHFFKKANFLFLLKDLYTYYYQEGAWQYVPLIFPRFRTYKLLLASLQ